MSYILDALKKATTEREHQRGNIPDLSAQPVRGPPDHGLAREAGLRGRWLTAAALMLAVCVMAALVWRLLPVPHAESALPLSLPAARAVVTVPTGPAAEPTPARALHPNTALSAAPVMPPPLPRPSAPPKPADQTLMANANRAPSVSAGAVPMAPLAITADNRQTPPLPTLPTLPDAAPKLVVSGSTYSDNAAHRILIVNGQVFREGESPAAGIKIEKIGARAAVLQYEGALFSLRY